MRYQNSVLGVLWVLIKPYATFIVLFLIWSRIRQNDDVEFFSLYLLTGIIFYTYITEMVTLGMMSLLDKAGIILKVNFPRQIAVIASQFNALINLVINMLLIVIFILANNIQVTLGGLAYFIFLTISAFIACLGISFFFSIVSIRFRDLKNIVDLGFFLLYWLTPIFFTLSSFPLGSGGVMSYILKYNPVGILINQVRAALGVYGTIDVEKGIIFFLGSLIIFILGWSFFNKRIKRVAEYF